MNLVFIYLGEKCLVIIYLGSDLLLWTLSLLSGPEIENAKPRQFDIVNVKSLIVRELTIYFQSDLTASSLTILFCLYPILSFFRRIGDGLDESLPNIKSIVLTNNNIQELADIEKLSALQSLEFISLLHNSVVSKPNYRAFVVHKFPNLRVLDFKKVKQKEKDEAKLLFKSKKGKEQLKEIEKKAKTFIPGGDMPNQKKIGNASGLTPEQVKNIKSAISKATTLEEIERLNQMLRTGTIPGEQNGSAPASNGNGNQGEVEEMDE